MTENVALPAGAEWSDDCGEYRIIFTPDRELAGTDLTTYASAVQLRDGSIATDELPRVGLLDRAMTTAQARELATNLFELADIADQWAGVTR